MHKEFLETDQRPFPVPNKPWAMTQIWNDLLFTHWPVPAEFVRDHIPAKLAIDVYEGSAWIGVIPFRVSRMRLHYLPPIPYLHTYTELNVRTYVTYKGTPGVYFFTLDANKWPAVFGAQIGAFLRYRHAKMKLEAREGKTFAFYSTRKHPDSPEESFHVTYRPYGEKFISVPGSLEFWLYERYCFFQERGGHLYRGDIHHDRWRIYEAEVNIHTNTMASFLPRKYFFDKPIAHYTTGKQVFAWPLDRIL